MKRPGEVMPPQGLEDDFLQELELVRHPALPAGVFHCGLGGSQRGQLTDGGHPRTLKAFVELRGLPDAFSSCTSALIHCHCKTRVNPRMSAVKRKQEPVNSMEDEIKKKIERSKHRNLKPTLSQILQCLDIKSHFLINQH